MQEKPDLRIAAVVGVMLAFLIAIGNLYWQVERMRGEMTNLRQSVVAEVAKVTQAAAQAASKNGRTPAHAAEPSQPKARNERPAGRTQPRSPVPPVPGPASRPPG